MKKISKKQQKINNKLRKVYKEIALTRPHYCTGCGRSDVPLSHSHIIPRSRRPDLQCDPENITYHCLGNTERKGCHQLYEGTKEEKQLLLDYHKSLEYILEKDTEYYFLLVD